MTQAIRWIRCRLGAHLDVTFTEEIDDVVVSETTFCLNCGRKP